MASHSIEIPGNANVTMVEGDTLTITFKSPAKFCIVSGNADDFDGDDGPLPVGIAEAKDYVWSGQAVVPSGTVTYTHVGHDGSCSSAGLTNVPPGTIQIGIGVE